LFLMAAIAITAEISAATSALKRPRVPNCSDPERSTANRTVSSRSSVYFFT
jgi:hypothetical protein